jgi:hypothetical protein
MAGLVPAISLKLARPCAPRRDCRNKLGNDTEKIMASFTSPTSRFKRCGVGKDGRETLIDALRRFRRAHAPERNPPRGFAWARREERAFAHPTGGSKKNRSRRWRQ